MAEFKQIIKDFVQHSHFMGDAKLTAAEKAALEKEAQIKRTTLLAALDVRKAECMLRFKWALAGLIIGVLVLMCLILFNDKAMEMLQKCGSILGGASILGLFSYLLSLRDEITKIKQTVLIAKVVDTATLNTMLLTLATAAT